LYGRQRKTDDALRIVEQGLKQQPGNFGLQLTLATLLEAKRDYDGAITQYEVILKEQPGSLVVANNLASLLADHRTDKASLERAGALAAVLKNSDVAQFKDTLGWVSYQRQDYRGALRLLEDAAKALPNLAMVQYHLGMSYQATGQEDKAGDAFAKARKLAPNDSELLAKIDAALKSRPEKAKG
jgi:Tfp pilus assembly protein PilF